MIMCLRALCKPLRCTAKCYEQSEYANALSRTRHNRQKLHGRDVHVMFTKLSQIGLVELI